MLVRSTAPFLELRCHTRCHSEPSANENRGNAHGHPGSTYYFIPHLTEEETEAKKDLPTVQGHKAKSGWTRRPEAKAKEKAEAMGHQEDARPSLEGSAGFAPRA